MLSTAESRPGDRVNDELGREVPAQRLSSGELVFIATEVPAFGSRHYRVLAGESALSGGCKLEGTTLENEHLRVRVDPVSGNISCLVQLATGRDFVDTKVNGGLNAFRWLPANVDAPVADTDIAISVIESGPVVVELRDLQSHRLPIRLSVRAPRPKPAVGGNHQCGGQTPAYRKGRDSLRFRFRYS